MVGDRTAPLHGLLTARGGADPADPLPVRRRGDRRAKPTNSAGPSRPTWPTTRTPTASTPRPAPTPARDSRAGVPALLRDLASRAATLEGPASDRKLALLITTLKNLIKDGYDPIVFCRYIPTAEYVAEHLDGQLGRKTVIAAVTGTLSPAQRIERIEKLAEPRPENGARRVLVATDCLSEGVNLQHHFNAVVHYDLAWNPTRHEQREGRVDRFGQRSADVRVVTIYGSDNDIDGMVLDVLIRKHREIRKSTGISVPVPDETSAAVTDAVVEWLLRRDKAAASQQALFDLDEVTGQQALDLDAEWNSMAERERRSRSRYAQGSIHPDDVAREVTATRTALGSDDEIRSFTRTALRALGGDLTGAAPTATSPSAPPRCPAGLRDSIAAVTGERPAIPFRTAPGVPRGEAALTRTDPIVGAVAHFVLSAALDKDMPGRYRPARRCGVIRTSAVTRRTTLLLVRYRFQLILPGRHGDRPLIAEDARVLGFEGPPQRPGLAARRHGGGPAGRQARRQHGHRVRPGRDPPGPRRPAPGDARTGQARRRIRRGPARSPPPGAPRRRPGRARHYRHRRRATPTSSGTYVYLPVSAETGASQ